MLRGFFFVFFFCSTTPSNCFTTLLHHSNFSLCLRSRLRIAPVIQGKGHFLCKIILTPLPKCELLNLYLSKLQSQLMFFHETKADSNVYLLNFETQKIPKPFTATFKVGAQKRGSLWVFCFHQMLEEKLKDISCHDLSSGFATSLLIFMCPPPSNLWSLLKLIEKSLNKNIHIYIHFKSYHFNYHFSPEEFTIRRDCDDGSLSVECINLSTNTSCL